MKYLSRVVSLSAVVLLLLLGMSASVKAQVPHSCEFWIVISDSDSAPTTSTLYYGDYDDTPNGGILATYGIDGQINPTIIEQDYPPPSFTFDVRFIDIPSRASIVPPPMAGGIKPYNFQAPPTNALVRDTFNVNFQDGDRLQADFAFRWPSREYLAARCDSMFFRYRYFQTDPDGNPVVTTVIINMMNQDNAVITRPQDLTLYDARIINVLIIKYGSKLVDAVRQESPIVPSGFALHQNYPNPFNPTTTVKFDILQRAMTNISVYNIIGQRVATLLSENLAPGTYTATWNGTSDQGFTASSGVYFMRMTADGFDGRNEHFSALRKIVLMK